MKKILIPILCIIMSVTCFANSASDLTEMNYEGITVTFSEGSNYTNDEKKIIADRLVYGYTEEENNSSTYAWCWLTGHNLTNESVLVTEHKVKVSDPRCKQTLYDVETCSKCDHYVQTETGSTYISCCPEE